VPEHNVPTTPERNYIKDDFSRLQVETLEKNCREFGVARRFSMNDPRQGIVHIIGPEQGATLPGMTVVCGDSHTSTHGAFACLALGVGTTEIEHILATQCLIARKSKTMRITAEGELSDGVSAKDLVLAIIGKIGVSGGAGCALEYAGSAIRALSMEGRMTVCNMSIEAGARAGMIAVDDKTLSYINNRPLAPRGKVAEKAREFWQTLASDTDAVFDREETIDAAAIRPQVSWGTSPEMVAPIDGHIPDPAAAADPAKRAGIARALDYMGLRPKTAIADICPDHIFIGSCTNARLGDLRAAAEVLRGRRIAKTIRRAMVVPGSGLVRRAAEDEGLDEVFRAAGFEWRAPGCSMCLGMNEDKMAPQDRCASTSNRNFEGRQGYKSRTHLVSPRTAAAAAVAGHFIDASALSR
jgi:3-isopropylmalate/(R)-2-methylmalate dehydratase large subunit